jgi:LPS-assembly protein
MTFEFAGVPVFWLPWFSHSDGTIERKSGFLTPEFAASDDIGLGVVIPYYWALAPNYDLTFLPLFTTDQGVMPRAVWRQRTGRGQYFVDAAGIYQLDADSLSPPGNRDLRGSVRSAGEFLINENWTWGWDAAVATDDTFMRRYEVDDREEILSQAHLTGLDDRNFFRARALHFDNYVVDNDDISPVALPYVEHDYTFDQPVFGGELGVRSSMYSLHRDEFFTGFYPGVNQGTDQTRGTTDVHWQRQLTMGNGVLATPFARLRGDIYLNDNLPDPPDIEEDDGTTTRLLPSAGLDLRWPFVRATSVGQHVITPVAQVVAATDETYEDEIGNEDAIDLNFDHTNLFLHDRFSGDDRYEGGTRVNTGVLYSYLMGNGGFLRASVGESFHVAGENSFVDGSGLEDSQSDLVAAVAFQPWENLRLTYQTRFDNDGFQMAVQEGTVDLDLEKFSLNGGFTDVDAAPAYGRPTDELQAWAAATVPLHAGWLVFGGMKYDFLDDEIVRQQIGFGYDCDCFQFKFAYTNSRHEEDNGDLDKDHSFMLSVKFKTLGGSGEDDGF